LRQNTNKLIDGMGLEPGDLSVKGPLEEDVETKIERNIDKEESHVKHKNEDEISLEVVTQKVSEKN